MKLGKEGNLVN